MTNKSLASINGQIVSEADAKISVFDRGFLFGDSVYEVTYTENKVPLFLTEHLDRLDESAQRLSMVFDFSRDVLIQEIKALIAALSEDKLYIRIIITRGVGEITLDPNMASGNNRIILAKTLPENPPKWYREGVHMIIPHVRRNSPQTLDPAIKSGNYLNNVMAMAEAKRRQAFDAIMLNEDGHITEATTSNIWIIKDRQIITPPLEVGILEGITRRKILHLARQEKWPVKEQKFGELDLKGADEVFLTSTTKKVVPIVQVDDQLIGDGKPGPLTHKISQLYHDFIEKVILNE